MAKILEYISLNYTWFLVAAIVIVLAIVGRYAEKSNFGQDQTKKDISPEDEDKKLELDKVTLSDLINKESKNKNVSELENINAQEIFNENSLEDIPDGINELQNSNEIQMEKIEQADNFNNQVSNATGVNSANIDGIDADLFSPIESIQTNTVENPSVVEGNGNNIEKSNLSTTEATETIENIGESHDSVDLTETNEDISVDFDKAFDKAVPKKDVINDTILEDIEDLSLENTQIFNSEDIPDLDDVDLPEIRDTNLSENDIWKF